MKVIERRLHEVNFCSPLYQRHRLMKLRNEAGGGVTFEIVSLMGHGHNPIAMATLHYFTERVKLLFT